ncbi:peritrophin-1-like [Wyeomyia smithii]|uniref:peritrophin-1-like n=1 Tax=Wyeomyia smithii TaxID=174621 RepID=UPI0024681D0A|nr:peritrophin-1-like [Wyeomyia smithii]
MLIIFIITCLLATTGVTLADSECPPIHDPLYSVYLRHESDCSKFYQCSNGVPMELQCPSGLLFNDQLNVCDWPSHVDCGGGGVSTESSGKDTERTTTPKYYNCPGKQ